MMIFYPTLPLHSQTLCVHVSIYMFVFLHYTGNQKMGTLTNNEVPDEKQHNADSGSALFAKVKRTFLHGNSLCEAV